MATTGYILGDGTDTGERTTSMFEHTNVNGVGRLNGLWHAAVGLTTGPDPTLWSKNLSTPGTAGTEGGWEVAQLDGGGNVEISATGSHRPSLMPDEANDDMHFFLHRDTNVDYSRYNHDSVGNDWTKDKDQDACTDSVAPSRGSMAVARDGVVWYARVDASEVTHVDYRARADTSWSAGGTINSGTASTTDVGTYLFDWTDDDGDDAMGLLMIGTYSGDRMLFTSRKDSDSKTAAWSTPEVVTTTAIDNHIHACRHEFGADGTSTIIAVYKNSSSDQLYAIRRDPDGTWDSETTVGTQTTTRPRCVMDSENKEVYLFFVDAVDDTSVNVLSLKSDATTTLSFTDETVQIEDDGVAAFDRDIAVPGHSCDSTTGIMLLAQKASGTEVWWHEITIAAAPAGPKNPLGHPVKGPFGGPIG